MPEIPADEPPSPPAEGAPANDVRYVVRERIGKGGMGQVFLAWDQNLSRAVAIKRIASGGDAGVDEAIRREAGILAALHHPNIVTIHDFTADEQGPFVVMEHVAGRTLDDLVSAHPLEVPAFLEMVNQVCRGLSSAHAAGLLHLDLKPGNIMLQRHQDGSFTSKILDFGLARLNQEPAREGAEPGVIFGSPYTISPEQLAREPVDVRTDIYSLGCVFYFALSGVNPFEAPSIREILQRHLQGGARPLHLVAPKVPQALSIVIARMIARQPADRPRTVEEARTQLLKAGRSPVSAATASAASAAPVRRRGFGKTLAILALPALLLAGGGAWYYYQQHRTKGSEAVANVSATPVVPAGPVVKPGDLAALEQHSGETITLEGKVAAIAESSLFHARFLKFADTPEGGAVAAVREEVLGAAQVQSFVGKRVRVTGKLLIAAGVKRVVVESTADIVTLP